MSQRIRRQGQRGQHIRLRRFCGGQHGCQNRNLVVFLLRIILPCTRRVNAGNQARDPVSTNDVESAAHVVVDCGDDVLGREEVKALLVGTIRCDDRDRAASRTGIGAVVAGRQGQPNDGTDGDRQDSDDVLAHAPHV